MKIGNVDYGKVAAENALMRKLCLIVQMEIEGTAIGRKVVEHLRKRQTLRTWLQEATGVQGS